MLSTSSKIKSRSSLRNTSYNAITTNKKIGLDLFSEEIVKPKLTNFEEIRLKKKILDKEGQLPKLTIEKSLISLYSWEEMQRIAQVKITNSSFSGSGSVNDPMMGIVDLDEPCPRCFKPDCSGHYGLIEFGVPIYNPSYMRDIVRVLSCVCKSCGKFLLTEEKVKDEGFHLLSYEKRLEEIEKYCNKEISCMSDKDENPNVLPCGRNNVYITKDIMKKCKISYRIPDENKKLNEVDHIMSTQDVFNILDSISDKDSEILGFINGSHPRNMIMKGILVPPPISRPKVYEGGPVNEDKLTVMFSKLVKEINKRKKETNSIALSDKICSLVNFILTGTSSDENEKNLHADYKSVKDRIKGKQEILRGALMGKRNNYCGRTVAGPDPSLKFGEIRIPKVWESKLTKNVRVTEFNREYLQKLYNERKIPNVTSNNFQIKVGKPYLLKIGDYVKRFLQEGDRIVTNRQPTLHSMSMMGYKVVFGKELTIGLHLSYTTPMNCDFDGDENNAWNPQDFEVEAEVENVMNVKNLIISPEQNKPTMGMVMNSVTGCYLLTDDKTIIKQNLFKEILSILTNKNSIPSLYHRLKKYGINPNSGKALFSVLLPEDFYYNQGNVVILEGVLISGQLSKSHVGTSHRSIIQELYKKYGPERTSDFFTDTPYMINKWLIERGFSVGICDVINIGYDENGKKYDKNKNLLEKEISKIYLSVESLGGKAKNPLEEIARENKIVQIMKSSSDTIGLRLVKETVSENNSIGVMIDQKNNGKGAGTKGTLLNISQIMGSIGQQSYKTQRLKPSITNNTRLLPMYDENDLNPESQGFIPQSFYTGTTPQGLFFLQAGAREGLLDTNLKTAETGAIQRKMVKAFENIVIAYDGSLRNTIGTLFTPSFNFGYSTDKMLNIKQKNKNLTSFIDLDSLILELNSKRGWIREKDKQKIEINKVSFKKEKSFLKEISFSKSKPYKKYEIPDLDKDTYNTKLNLKITKYEKSRIIGTRATQLSNNSKPLYDIGNEVDPVTIATNEFNLGVLKIFVIRKYTDGTFSSVYPTLENI
jgi:DNA-directed RNA polymerase II subunit RPB1